MDRMTCKRGIAARVIGGSLCFFLAGAAWSAPAPAAAQQKTTQQKSAPLPKGVSLGPSAEGITEYRLANGLKVLLFPDNSRPTVTVNVTYLVGSRHENYGETGMAHLLEHLLFKGTKKNPDITGQFARRGMDFNGTTSLDRTNYYEVFQASPDNLNWALQMEADRMVNSPVAQKDLASEMTVVRNEFESGENSPAQVLFKRMQSVAYDWHSYGRPTIGNRSDIENVRIANLQAFYRTWYQPDNAVLLVAGKFEPNATLAQINRLFGAIPKPKRALPQFWTVEPTQDGERSFAVRRQGDVQIVALGYKIPSDLQQESEALGFASEILPRLGEPYVTSRPQAKARRALAAQIAAAASPGGSRGRGRKSPAPITAPIAPSQGGMGLGFFIARTLLERSGGKVSVGAGDGEKGQPKGARVTVRWPRQALETADPALEPRKA